MVFNTQFVNNLSLKYLATNLEASGNCDFAMPNVKQDNFFSLILFVPKNQNNGLHPSESSDITNTQNWFFQFCFFFSTSGLVNELMAS